MAALGLALFGVMFVVVFVLRTVVQKRRTGDSGIRSGVLGASFGSVEWVAGWLFVLAMLAGVAAPVAELVGLAPFFDSTALRAVGAVVAVAGIGLTFASQLSMGEQWRIGVDPDEETALVTDEAFAVVRNPIFGCMILVAVGLTLLVPNVISLIGLVMLVATIELQVRLVEEPYLRTLHGDTYAAYAANVGRLIPGVGRD